MRGIRLRRAGISGQILILGYTHPDAFPELKDYRLTQTAVDLDYAGEISAYYGNSIAVHVGVDTGMHRLGIPYDRTDLVEKVWALPGIRVTGVFSHLCVSDGLTEAEDRYTREQIKRFDHVTEYLRAKGIAGFQTHIQGSYGILNYPEYSYNPGQTGDCALRVPELCRGQGARRSQSEACAVAESESGMRKGSASRGGRRLRAYVYRGNCT